MIDDSGLDAGPQGLGAKFRLSRDVFLIVSITLMRTNDFMLRAHSRYEPCRSHI